MAAEEVGIEIEDALDILQCLFRLRDDVRPINLARRRIDGQLSRDVQIPVHDDARGVMTLLVRDIR